jgi:hypothetical protein
MGVGGSAMPRQLYPQKRVQQVVRPQAVMDGCGGQKISCRHWGLNHRSEGTDSVSQTQVIFKQRRQNSSQKITYRWSTGLPGSRQGLTAMTPTTPTQILTVQQNWYLRFGEPKHDPALRGYFCGGSKPLSRVKRSYIYILLCKMGSSAACSCRTYLQNYLYRGRCFKNGSISTSSGAAATECHETLEGPPSD